MQAYQRQQQEQQQKAASAARQQLTSNPKSFIGDSPTRGAKDQKLILVAFSDFQCPFCGKTQKTLKDFIAANGKEVTFIYKLIPPALKFERFLPCERFMAYFMVTYIQYHYRYTVFDVTLMKE